MAVETVTVRMSRSDGSTPWGFRLQGGQEFGNALTIGSVAAGSLADRAGLQNGDSLTQLCGRDAVRMSHQDAQNTIVSSGNTLDLVVQRAGGAHIWKPSITLDQDTTVSKFQHTVHSTGGARAPPSGPAPPPPTSAPPAVKVSLEHQSRSGANIPGYNSTARPFGGSGSARASSPAGGPQVKHLQYNSPLNLYSPNSAAEQYLQQTGGLFGTDPNLNKAKEEPAYLKSATLRLIQETEHEGRGGRSLSPRQPNEWAEGRSETLHHTDAQQQSDSFKRLSSALGAPADGTPAAFTATQPYVAKETIRPETQVQRETSPGRASPRFEGGMPVCYSCGRTILGVFCKASGKSLHPECFNCSTCGVSLKNVGHILHNNKLYCETHGNQNKNLHFGAAPPVAPNAFLPRSVAPPQPRGQEPVKAFYQPDIMARGPVRVSPTPWKSHSPISPSNRGVPRAPAMYGADLNSARNLSVNVPNISSQPIAMPPPPPPTQTSSAAYNSGGGSHINTSTSTYSKFSSNMSSNMGPSMGTNLGSNIGSNMGTNLGANLGANLSATSAAPFSNGGTSPGGAATQPRRGRGILKQTHDVPRIPICEDCHREIRGPFVLAMGITWCPEHFVCANNSCRRKLLDIGFVEEKGAKYCEVCFEQYMAPRCSKCSRAITGDCLNAIHKQWHPECFVCAHCHQPFGNSAFFLEEGRPYCERDWNQMFTTKCVACKFPIEAGDRWVEAINAAYHSDCFNCSKCQKNLEGQSFYAKGGLPYCKAHA